MEGFADLAEHFQVLEDSGVLLFHGDFLHESWWLFTIERSRGVNLINDGVDDDDGGGGDDDVVVDDVMMVLIMIIMMMLLLMMMMLMIMMMIMMMMMMLMMLLLMMMMLLMMMVLMLMLLLLMMMMMYYIHTYIHLHIYILYYTYVDIGGYITTVILLGHNPVGKPWAQELLAKKLSSKNLRKAMAPCKEECF